LKAWSKSLAVRLLVATWIVSSIGTFAFTAIQVFLDYNQSEEKLLKTFDVVQLSYLAPITESVWGYDNKLIEAQVLGLSKLDGVSFVSVVDGKGEAISEIGDKNVEGSLEKSYELVRDTPSFGAHTVLGYLKVHLDIYELRREFVKKAILIFAIQGLKAFLVSTILFLVFNSLVVSRIVKKIKSLRAENQQSFQEATTNDKDELETLIHTVERLMQENQRALEKLREVNEHLEQRVAERTSDLEAFSYSVAHDLRSPLRSVNGFATILMDDFSQSLPTEAQAYVKRIVQASIRMGNLIDDVLTISKISRETISRRVFNISEAVNDVVEQKRQLYPNTKFNIEIESDLKLNADPRMVLIALDNVIDNAFKYSSKKDQAQISFKYDRNLRAFVVSDNGVGFDMKYVAKIFGIFQRLHSHDEFPGTGVGLAFVDRIIRKHGGRIWAESVLEKGTRIFFSFGEDSI